MRVAITGASGHIGSVLCARLSDTHELRGCDVRPPQPEVEAWCRGGFVIGDCARPAVAAEAVEGVQAVVHLAGVPTEADLPTILHTHVETTAALLDAMVQFGIDRMVYASSNHAVGMTPRTERLDADVRPRPDTFYGVGKVAAEALLSLYADRHSISSVAMRIGSFLETPETQRNLSTWLSYDDCVSMVQAALVADVKGFAPIYGISANSSAWWDLDPGRSIGYQPEDDAADYAGRLPDRIEDAAEAAHVGGPFATSTFDSRPFPDQTDESSGA
ncbi:MAG: NAD(P)-dependent oxidoreductase [Nocardioidaceae bacterium]